MKKNIHIIVFLLYCYSIVFADDLQSHVCPSTESALACNELCKLADYPKIIFSFKVNEKNNVVLRIEDYFDINNDTKLLGIPIPLGNCSVVSKQDWICGIEKQKTIKVNVGAYIDLIHGVRYSGYNKNISENEDRVVHVMRDGQYSVLRYDEPSSFKCLK